MTIDLAAAAFMTTHARLLDRRRFAVRFEGGDPDGALAALDAYRNADGGYGWALEPDLRAPESQPGAALHAFEVLAEVAPATSPRARLLAVPGAPGPPPFGARCRTGRPGPPRR